MSNKPNSSRIMNSRKGGIAIIVIVIFIFIAEVTGGIFISGQNRQASQEKLLSEGFELFSKGEVIKAIEPFTKAKTTFGKALNFFRSIKSSEKYVTVAEIDELILSSYLLQAHNDFFVLKPSKKLIKKAQESLKIIEDGPNKKEFEKVIETAVSISKICSLYHKKNIKKAMKDLLLAEKNASVNDQDFFIFEIRFLIACGKRIKDPEILKQARELLFFLNFEVGVKNDKIDQLWQLLRS